MRAMRPEIESADVAAAPVVIEGGRSPSTLSTGSPGMTPNPSTIGPLAPGQRWSVARKREVVLRLLRGESVELLSRELGVLIYKLEQWREKADVALTTLAPLGVTSLSGALHKPTACPKNRVRYRWTS